MSVKKVNKTTGATTKVAGLVNSEKVNTMYGAFPSDASASNKLVSDATADDKISDESQVIFEVMGKNGAKNLLKSTLKTNTYDGLTFTVGTDGSVTLSGTATSSCGVNGWGNFGAFSYPAGNYILSDGGAGSQASSKRMYYKINNGNSQGVVDSADITLVDGDLLMVWIYVDQGVSGNGSVFYPMLRLASDTDNTYQPYAKTNQQLTEDTTALLDNLEVNGAVNMLPNTATTRTVNGITFTVNDDDGTIDVSGTATANANLAIGSFNVKAGTQYTISDGIGTLEHDNVAGVMYATSVPAQGEAAWYWRTDYIGAPVDRRTAIANYDAVVTAYIRIPSGVTVNYKFKPMFTLASYNGNYVPYAKSNREITDVIPSDASSSNKLVTAFSNTFIWTTGNTETDTLEKQPRNTRYLFQWNALKLCSDIPGDLANISHEAISECTSVVNSSMSCQTLNSRDGKVYFRWYDVNNNKWGSWVKINSTTEPKAVIVNTKHGDIIKNCLNAIDPTRLTKDSMIYAFGLNYRYMGYNGGRYNFSAVLYMSNYVYTCVMSGTKDGGYYIEQRVGANGTVVFNDLTETATNTTVNIFV